MMKCKRCGDDEDRFGGCCSYYCRDMYDLEQEIKENKAAINCFIDDLIAYTMLMKDIDADNIKRMIDQYFIEYEEETWRLRSVDEEYIHPDNKEN